MVPDRPITGSLILDSDNTCTYTNNLATYSIVVVMAQMCGWPRYGCCELTQMVPVWRFVMLAAHARTMISTWYSEKKQEVS